MTLLTFFFFKSFVFLIALVTKCITMIVCLFTVCLPTRM